MDRYYKNLEYAILWNQYQIDQHCYRRPCIVLRDRETKLVGRFTNYQEYILTRLPRDMNVWSTNENWAYAIVQFLNYIMHNHGVVEIVRITLDMVKEFLDYYCGTMQNGRYPGRESCKDKRAGICTFLWSICYERERNPELPQMLYLQQDDILTEVAVKTKNGMDTKIIPRFHVPLRYHDNMSGLRKLYRDMPLAIAPVFLKMAQVYDPELTFAIALGMFAGLREGEICNVRRKDSPLGPGILVRHDGNTCREFSLDLRDEYVLRDDKKRVGDIKRERMAAVYPKFLNIVYHFYQAHLELIQNKPTDENRPMFVNKNRCQKNGLYHAMTVSGYKERIDHLFRDHVLPSIQYSENRDLQMFYNQMRGHSWGAHSFRHWFTVFLVLDGCSDTEVRDYRGDRSILSSQVYLERKGELQKLYSQAVNQVSLKMLMEGNIL